MDFKGKKVLVAGGTGLIGIPLVKMLIEEEGANVRVASLDDPSRAHPDTAFCFLDLTDFENCKKACRGMDYVFNLLCAKGSPTAMKKYPATFFDVNLLLDVNMLRAAYQEGVGGYLLASSLAVYPPASVFKEDDAFRGVPSENDRFAADAKRAGERQAEAYRLQYNWNRISIVRPTNTYGPYDNFNPENAMVIPSLIRKALDYENAFTVAGNGSEVRDFLYSDDVAHGMLLVAKLEETRPVNLGSGTGVSIRTLVETILKCVDPPREAVVWSASHSAGDSIRVMDVERARSIGFTPIVSFQEGIRETVEWHRLNKDKLDKQYSIFKPPR